MCTVIATILNFRMTMIILKISVIFLTRKPNRIMMSNLEVLSTLILYMIPITLIT